MNKEELRELIDSMDVYMPICKIEESVGMAKTTLQKALKYEDKKLPKKWVKPLINFCQKMKVSAPENTLTFHAPTNKIPATKEHELSLEVDYTTNPVAYDMEKIIPDHDEPKKYQECFPKSIQEIRDMCPGDLTGIDRTIWVGEQKKKYNIL